MTVRQARVKRLGKERRLTATALRAWREGMQYGEEPMRQVDAAKLCGVDERTYRGWESGAPGGTRSGQPPRWLSLGRLSAWAEYEGWTRKAGAR